MRRLIAALSAAVLLLASAPAWAGGGYGYGYGHHGYGYRVHSHWYGHGDGAIVVGALVGGLVLGHLLTRPAYYPAPAYYAPPPPRLVLGNCKPTTGTGYLNGYPAQFGGTMCFDQFGRGYITPGSEYFIGYLN